MAEKIGLLMLGLILLITGCGAKEEESAVAQEDPGYDFILVCPIVENEYWQTCIEGIRQADTELGTTTQVIGADMAEDFPTEMAAYMEQAIASAPDGIMGYAGVESVYPLINKAVRQGIPFLAIDSDAPDTDRVAYIGTDDYAAGYLAGETMVDLTGGTAKIGILVSDFSAERELNIIHAFQDAIADYDMEITAMEESVVDPDIAEANSKAMLEKHPEITAMFNTGGYNITGAAQMKQALGLDELTLIGFDDIEENLAFVREGVINAILVQSPYQMGYQGVYLLKECVDNGSLSQETFDTGTVLVTQENVDSYQDK